MSYFSIHILPPPPIIMNTHASGTWHWKDNFPPQTGVLHFHVCWREGRERERERERGTVAATIARCFVLSAACLGHIEDNLQTALFYAARQGHVNTCNFLVCSKADVTWLPSGGPLGS